MPISFQYHYYCYSIILLSIYYFTTADGTQLILVNNCKEDVWPGILGNAGQPSPKDGGFLLPTGQEAHLQLPRGWSGRIWARQGCIFDPKTATGSCQTGDCAGLLQCKGIGGALPATLVEMTLGTSQTPTHFYDVSLVDGFNLPVSMRPVGGGGECGVAACEADLNSLCPSALVLERNGKVVGCKSACLGARTERYCCSGEYANPEKCKPSVFARIFKAACPDAYSYAYDESSGLKTCKASRYSITFCPPKA